MLAAAGAAQVLGVEHSVTKALARAAITMAKVDLWHARLAEAWWASAQSPWCGNLWKAARRLDHIAQRRYPSRAGTNRPSVN